LPDFDPLYESIMKKFLLGCGGVFALAGVLAGVAFSRTMAEAGESRLREEKLVRVPAPMGKNVVINLLAKNDVIANPRAFNIWEMLNPMPNEIKPGVYRFKPGMTPAQMVAALQDPVKQSVRIPEGRWVARVAEVLEEKGVCTAEEYIAATKDVGRWQKQYSWIPEGLQSLEGFLFPDTYNFPPGIGADFVIDTQLATFKRRMGDDMPEGEKLKKMVITASLIELEAKADAERPMVAGVIENRLKKPMRLQIDATVLYALQKWQVLGPGVVNTVQSPFNTYTNDGLPPGAIGAPSIASLKAAMNPVKHNYYFYVTKEDGTGTHFFATTYGEHLNNIRKSRATARAKARAK
jgi:UPF0755 protein